MRPRFLLAPFTVLCALTWGGCQGESSSDASVGKDEATPRARVDPAPADRAAVVQRCTAAVERGQKLQGNGGELLVQAQREVGRSCAEMYGQPRCRDAFVAMHSRPPEEKIPFLIRECTAAYCPVLEEPKPALCDDIPADPRERLKSWQAFTRAMAIHDARAGGPS